MIAKGLPTAAIEFISDFDLADVFRILVAELGRDSRLHRETVFAREHLPIEPEGRCVWEATRLACRNLMRGSPDHAMRGMVRPVQRKSQLFGIRTVSTT
jgi:hypothetical protein